MFPSISFAHDDALSRANISSGTTVTYDGNIDPSVNEWTDTASGEKRAYFTTVTGQQGCAYFKTNGSYLYVGFYIPDGGNSSNNFARIGLDLNHNGNSADSSDYMLTIRKSDGENIEAKGNGYGYNTSVTYSSETTNKWSAKRIVGSTYWEAEFKIYFSKLGLTSTTSKTFGLSVGETVQTPSYAGVWPSGSSLYSPSTFGNAIFKGSDNFANDTTAPTVDFTGPADNSLVSGSVNFTIQPHEEDSGLDYDRTAFVIDDDNIEITGYPFNHSWVVPTDAASNGAHTVTYTAYDRANNVATVNRTYIVDTLPPDVITGKDAIEETSGIESETWTSKNNPSFRFNWEDNESGIQKYIYYFGPDSAGTPAAETTSNNFTPSPLTAEGTYYLKVKARDNTGKESAVEQYIYKYDGNAPTKPISITEIHGYNSNDPVTNINNPSFSWANSTDSGSGIESYDVYFGTDSLCPPPYDNVNNSTFTPATLSESGVYYLRIRAIDNVGRVSAWSDIFTYRADVSSPTNGTAMETHAVVDNEWTNNADPCFELNGDDDESGLAGYTYYFGPSSSGTPATYVTGTTIDPAALTTEGTYYLRVRAKDNAGNQAATETVFVFKYDASKPIMNNITADVPDNGPWSNNISPNFYLSSDCNISGLDTYRIYWGTNPTALIPNQPDQIEQTFNPTIDEDGSYYLKVWVKDTAGNISDPKTYRYNADVETPKPMEGMAAIEETHGTESGSYTSLINPSFRFNWIDETSSVAGYRVYWGTDPSQVPSTPISGNTFQPPIITADNTYFLKVVAIDNAGNVSSPAEIFIYRFSSVLPSEPGAITEIHGIANNDPWTKRTNPSFIWDEPAGGTSGLAEYEISWDTDEIPTPPFESTAINNRSFTPPSISEDGIYHLKVRSKDLAGKTSGWREFIYRADITAPEKQDVAVIENNNVESDVFTAESNPSFELNWQDTSSGIEGYTYYFGTNPNGTPSATQTATTGYLTSNLLEPGKITAEGTYYLRVKVKDKAGNETAAETVFTYKCDPSAPSTPGTIIETHGIASGSWTNNQAPSFYWEASKDGNKGSGFSRYDIYFGNNINGDVPTDSAESNTYPEVSVPSDGTFYFKVRATDNVGNVSPWQTFVYNYDTTPPTLAMSTLSEGQLVKGKVVLSPSFVDASGIGSFTVYIDDPATSAVGSGAKSVTWDTRGINDGPHQLIYVVRDILGNENQITQMVTVDNTKPKTYAPKKSVVRRGKIAKLYWKVADSLSSKAKVSLVIKKKAVKKIRGKKRVYLKTYKTIRLGLTAINKLKVKRIRIRLKRGKYRYYVLATDRAGNTQARVASNWLIVK